MTISPASSRTSLKGNPLEPKGTELRRFQGSPHPFGSTVERDGVNFSLYSSSATGVQLLIFNKPDDLEPCRVVTLDSGPNRSFNIWHTFIEGVKPGMGYADRVDGPREPWNGHRFNPEKVLVDPYSKGNCLSLWDRGASCVPGDNLHKSMRSVVVDTSTYDWEGDEPLKLPMAETIVYEMHVGGFTKSPTSGVKNPGTYLGLIEKIPYLKQLGICLLYTSPSPRD